MEAVTEDSIDGEKLIKEVVDLYGLQDESSDFLATQLDALYHQTNEIMDRKEINEVKKPVRIKK